jgi:nucleoid-associated protein YgaU
MKMTLAILIVCACFVPSLAQDVPPPPVSKADELLNCEEADARIKQLQGDLDAQKKKLANLQGDVKKFESDIANAVDALKKCGDQINTLVGASDADIAAFREKIGRLEGRVREMQRLSDDVLADRQGDVKELQRSLNEIARQQMSMIPEFYDRITALRRNIKGLYREKRIKGYTVGTWAENRDCLWNIAGRTEIYADPFMWPKIWQANTGQIKNPDVIQPGWVLTVPPSGPKTSEEMKAERSYWRKKRAAEAQAESGSTAPASAGSSK